MSETTVFKVKTMIEENMELLLTQTYFISLMLLIIYVYINYPPFFNLTLLIGSMLSIVLYTPLGSIINKHIAGGEKQVVFTPASNAEKKYYTDAMPDSIQIKKDYIILTQNKKDVYLGMVYINKYPARLPDGWVDRLVLPNENTEITQSIRPANPNTVVQQLIHRSRQIGEVIELSKGDTTKLQNARDWADNLKEMIINDQTKPFDFSIYFVVRAEDKKTLDKNIKTLQTRATTMMMKIRRLRMNALINGFKTIITPSYRNLLPKTDQMMYTECLTAATLFNNTHLSDQQGIFYGFNIYDNTPVIIDRYGHENYNSAIIGRSGFGKSTLSKEEIIQMIRTYPDIQIYIIDPLYEFGPLIQKHGGQVIRLGTKGKDADIINPFDITTISKRRITTAMGEKQLKSTDEIIKEKVSRLKGLLDLLLHLDPSGDKEERAMLSTALMKTYQSIPEIIETIVFDPQTYTGRSPTFTDLQNILKNIEKDQNATQKEKIVADKLIRLLEEYVTGPLSFWNGQTTIDLHSPYISFDISAITKAEYPSIMYMITDYISGKICEDDTRKKMVVIDEARHMLTPPNTRGFLDELIAESRHHNTGVTLITQDTQDLLKHPEGESILNNCLFTFIFQLRGIGHETQEYFSFSEEEKEAITKKAKIGRPLMSIGTKYKAVVDVEILLDEDYRLITTKPSDLIKMREEEQEKEKYVEEE